jgi:hypothetical protein
VRLLRDAKRKANSDCANAINSNDVFSMVTNSYKEFYEELNKGEVDAYKFTSRCKMGLDEAKLWLGKACMDECSAINFRIWYSEGQQIWRWN